jgi:tRNA-dihydrouridine synthase
MRCCYDRKGCSRNPWIFGRTVHFLETGELFPGPSVEEKINMIVRHMKMLVGLKGEHTGICEMRKHVAWYIKGLRNSTYVKEQVFKSTSGEEIIELLSEFFRSTHDLV